MEAKGFPPVSYYQCFHLSSSPAQHCLQGAELNSPQSILVQKFNDRLGAVIELVAEAAVYHQGGVETL